MTLQERIANDIGKNTMQQIKPILDLNLRIAQAGGLPNEELAMLCMKLAASLTNAMILAVIQFRKDGIDPAAMYDTTAKMLPTLLAPMKVEGLAVVAAHEAKLRSADA